MLKSPFVYLFVCSLKNRVVGRLRRLREPKYAIGAVVGALYLYLMFFRRVRFRPRRDVRHDMGGALPATVVPLLRLVIQTAGIIALWLVVFVKWILPVSKPPLTLTASERDFLLTAPVSRRRVVRYKLLRSFAGIFFGSAVALFFAWPAVGNGPSFLIGVFLLMTTLGLHLHGVALTRGRMFARHGRRDPAGVVALGVLLVGGVSLGGALLPGLIHLQQTGDFRGALDLISAAASRPVIAIGLMPFTSMVRPVFADWPGPFLLAALPVLALAVLNYRWVLGAEALSEDAVERTERDVVAGRRAAPRPVYRGAPFTLALRGRPELAVVWKNLILLGRYASFTMLMRVGVPLVMLALIAGTSRHTQAAASFLPVVIAIGLGLTVLGPYSFRNDLRQDLARLAVLKTWPVSGERLLLGEVLAPALAASLVVWLLMFVAAALSLAVPAASFAWRNRLAFGFSAALVCPALILAQVVVQNAAVVLFPGWMTIGPSRPRGVEAMGQQMLMFAGTMLVLVIGVLPGALVGGLVLFVGYLFVGWVAVVPAALILTALLVAEAVVAVHFLGAALDRMDPTAVEAAS